MRAGWVTKLLGEIANNLDSKRIPITKADREPGEIPYYGASGVVDHVKGHIFDEELLLVSEDGANLLARTYPIAFSVSGKTWVNNHAHVLQFEAKPTQKFVELYLNSIPLEPYVSGMAQPKLNQKQLARIPIPFPPLDEQQRIVAVLDEAFEGLDRADFNAEANLQNARALFDVRRAEIFSLDAEGEEVFLGDVCKRFEYGTAAKSASRGSIPVLRMGNLQDGEIDWSDLVYSDDPKDSRRYRLSPGDVLFNRTNSPAHVGKTSIYDGEQPAIFAGYLIRVVPDTRRLTPQFLNHFLNSDIAREYGRSVMGTSVNQANISGGRLKNYKIHIPTLARQAELAAELDRLKATVKPLQQHYRKRADDLKQLRRSLLMKAFAGSLT